MPPNSYAVRITHPAEIVNRICYLWVLRCDRLAMYEHDDDGANNIHCHLIIEGSSIEKKQLRNIAASVADVKGPKMSFRGDYDGATAGFAYMTKGKYDPKYLKGWSSDDAALWKAAWVPPQEVVKQTYWRKLYDKFGKEVQLTEREDSATVFQRWIESGDVVPPQTLDPKLIQSQIARYVLKLNQGLWSPKAAKDFVFLRDQVFIDKGIGFPTRYFV